MTDSPKDEAERLAAEYAEKDLGENERLVLRRARPETVHELFPYVIQRYHNFLAGYHSRDQEVERLREALQFYAESDHLGDDCEECWQLNGDALVEHQQDCQREIENGECARKALQGKSGGMG